MGRIRSKHATGRAERDRRGSPVARRPRAQATRSAALLAAGLGLGFAAGIATGSAPTDLEGPASPGPSVALAAVEAEAPTRIDAAAADPTGGEARGAGELLAEWLEMAEARRLEAMASRITGAGLDFVARNVIGRLEEDALAALIASTTDFSSAELAEIDDVPGFAMGLARIAMEGTVREAPEPAVEDDVRPIDFAEEITWDHRARLARSQFEAGTERIYAVFESDGLGLDQTLAKWTRVDDGEILLFERHRLRRAADSSFVYLDAPPQGFAPGEYRVDFYAADRSLRWIASGVHRVVL